MVLVFLSIWMFFGLWYLYYLYIKKTVNTWNKERFIRKKSVSLKDMIRKLRMLEELFRIVRIISLCIPFLLIVMILTNLDDPLMLEIFLKAIPVVFIGHFAYRIICLILGRAEELYRQQSLGDHDITLFLCFCLS